MRARRRKSGEEGYVLLALMLAVTLILIALSIEAPRVAQQIKRDREEELVHRGLDYATAIKRFVHKNGGRYPVSIEQLENTNHIRFLRKRYKDPMTGEDEWRLVHFGEAQVKIPTRNPGLGGSGGGPTGGGGTGGATGSGTGTLPTSNPGNPPQQPVGGGQIIGVASTSKKESIKHFNDKDHYNDWYFVYDLRLEQAGGTGVTVAEPRAQSQGQQSDQPGGTNPLPGPTPSPTPSPVPN